MWFSLLQIGPLLFGNYYLPIGSDDVVLIVTNGSTLLRAICCEAAISLDQLQCGLIIRLPTRNTQGTLDMVFTVDLFVQFVKPFDQLICYNGSNGSIL